MIVMPSNATGIWTGYLARQYENAPARLGHLYSPGKKGFPKRGPFPFMPYALDNGAWPAFKNRKRWNIEEWRKLLIDAHHATPPPMWALVPDVVGDREATLYRWKDFAPELTAFGWPLAFAAQDGMTFEDVPREASIVFIGGSDDWKWNNLKAWCARFPCHVGRVTGLTRLRLTWAAGAKSCDATGHFRTDRQRRHLMRFLAEANGEARADENPSWLSEPFDEPTARRSKSSTTAELAPTGAARS